MNISFWSCCGKNYTPAVKKCRKCGKTKPELCIIDDAAPPREKTNNVKSRPDRPLSKRKPANHLIGTEDRLFVSTLKMKDDN